MARTDQWHDERTEVITTPNSPEQGSDGYVDPDRTQVVSGIEAPDRDEPAHHEPVEQPTAFGAATVGGAVAASAMAGPERLHEPRDPRADDTVRMGDGPVADETAIGWAEPGDAEPADTTGPTDTTESVGTGSVDATEATATTGTAPVAATSFLGAEQAEAFRDRWRDVQLRFVDDPQGAAGQARELVTEAVEVLTAALTAQRDGLGGDGTDADDTEQLRMTVRRYRDLLDRLLTI
ncbi:hypothetical protein [Solwaraspora sp. WMMA2101]|uniref:hypothetical protein n=1 Tax=Solwaraspora sp. WMMA2101 TaxID=3404124 RepID=UPI003B929977